MLGHRKGLRTDRNSVRSESKAVRSFVRKAERIDIDAQVFLRRSGQLNYQVRAYDATRFGCKIEFIERPNIDEHVWVKFDGLSPVAGVICWIDGFVAGIEFVRAIHPAVFESLVARLR